MENPSLPNAEMIDAIVALLEANDIPVGPGLSEAEFRSVESRFSIQFGVDHRAMLQRVLPLGDGFPDWRNGSVADLRRRLDWPREGILWDVENNGFWPRPWGRRPLRRQGRERVTDRQLTAAAPLLPVFSHRFIPGGNAPSGVPVLSVFQSDVAVYGWNLLDYFRNELELPRDEPPRRTVVIPFWGQIAKGDPSFQRRGNRFRNLTIEGTPALPPGSYRVSSV